MPGLREALLLVAAASLLAEPLHDWPCGLVLCFSGVAISAAAAVHGDVACSRLLAPCIVARHRSLEVRAPALRPRVGGLGAGFVVGSRLHYSGDVAVMGRRDGGPRVLRWARPWPLMDGREHRAVR